LVIDPYFSATKIKWILDNVIGARDLANDGKLMFGTIDSFLIYSLTKEKGHFTDVTNASRTMLFNINTM
jgi:glycerol kinase